MSNTPPTNKQTYFIGLMSGTSMDGVDVVLVEFTNRQTKLISSYEHPIPNLLKQNLINTIHPNWTGSLESIGILNQQLGVLFSDAILVFLAKENIDKNTISAIGSHGQTLWHQPFGDYPFSMQLGDASLITETTGITTIADFRSRDVAAGGQGAPLAPAFHSEFLSHPKKSRAILNIGGIANVTLLPSKNSTQSISGFDTGPGNGLIDAWISKHQNKGYDRNGDWGKSGNILPEILNILLDDDYFLKLPPKSTGKEEFNLDWLQQMLGDKLKSQKPEDIQATLTELTAKSIANGIKAIQPADKRDCNYQELFICGGGIHNDFLIERLQHHLPETVIDSTEILGIHPDWMEAIAFAWLAKQTLKGSTSNLPEVTGAKGKRILGAIHKAN